LLGGVELTGEPPFSLRAEEEENRPFLAGSGRAPIEEDDGRPTLPPPPPPPPLLLLLLLLAAADAAVVIVPLAQGTGLDVDRLFMVGETGMVGERGGMVLNDAEVWTAGPPEL